MSNVIGETSDDNEDDDGNSTAIDIGEAATIRRQLDGLEGMYGEVLKLLGLRKFGREANVPGSGKSNGHGGNGPGGHHLRRHKMYGSMSSLPSVSSIGSRGGTQGVHVPSASDAVVSHIVQSDC